MSIKKLAKIIDVDPATIASWERSDNEPSQRYVAVINGFLKSYSPDKNLSLTSLPRNKLLLTAPIPKFIEYNVTWSIGRKIVAWRASLGLSQRQLAKITNVCLQSICRWEKGVRKPQTKYLNRIYKSLVLYVNNYLKIT